MSNVQPLKPKDNKPVPLEQFPDKLAELATMIVGQAMKTLPKAQFDMQLDAFKAATAYQAMLNRATEGDEGAAILDIREQLVRPTPEPKEGEEQEEDADGGAEDA